MATQIKSLSMMPDETTGTIAEVQVDWDDVSLRLLSARVINPTSRAIGLSFLNQRNGQTVDEIFPAGQTTVATLPPGAVNRFDITVIPVPGGIRLGGFELSTRWMV